jgi:glutaconate CoA-transferase, subunit B
MTLHPGVSLDDVRDNMGWEPRISEDVGVTEPPSADELRLIRHDLDPKGVHTR